MQLTGFNAATGGAAETKLPSAPLRAFTTALSTVLDELHDFIATLTDAEYRAISTAVFHAAIGDHVRHSLDHVRVLVEGLDQRSWDYEARDRGSDVETSPTTALAAIRSYRENIGRFETLLPDTPVRVSMMATSDGPSWETRSSLERELAFVLSHTIHHNAMIAVAAREIGKPVPSRFGYAPATTAFLEATACVPSR